MNPELEKVLKTSREYKKDPLKFYQNYQRRCKLCGGKIIVVKGLVKLSCDCTRAKPR